MGETQKVDVSTEVWRRVEWAREAALSVARSKPGWQSESRIEDIRFCTTGYAEPGYTDPACGIIASGNWNDITKWNPETRKSTLIDNTPGRLAKILDKLGVELEWSDEWTECHECYRFIRCQPDSYGWTPSYIVGDGCILCLDCIDPEDYLRELEDEDRRCNTIVDDPTKHGYLHIESFQNGFHRGQDASPPLIAGIMREAGFERFIFHIESQGQFDTHFGLYLHEEEAKDGGLEEATNAIHGGKTDGPSVSASLERNLKEVSRRMKEMDAGEDGIKVASIGTDGVRTKVVSAQDFIDGKALDWTEEE